MNSFLVWDAPVYFNRYMSLDCTLWSPHTKRGGRGVKGKRLDQGSSFGGRDNSFISLQIIHCARNFIRPQVKSNAADGTWINEWSPLSVIHNRGDVVAGKYKIIGILGQGGVATTYEAETEDGGRVALKAMSLRNMKGWKVDSDMDRAFYIVQMVAKGRSLAKLVQGSWRATEQEVKRIAIEVLEILQYLGSLRPPVIHRDIKPENIILDEDTGKIKLVDFGAVQDAASVTLIGSTVVGTYGYMAPEQFQNRATVQSDLYGLGGTILYLISGQPPSSFPQKRLKVEFQDYVRLGTDLTRIVERLLEPAPEDRFQSAAEVIEALRNNRISRKSLDAAKEQIYPGQRVRRPIGTKVSLRQTASTLEIKIPPVGLTPDAIGTGTFALAWNAFLLLWTRSAVSGGAPLFFTLFSLPFWFIGVRLAKSTLSNHAVSVDMKFGSSKFYIQWSVGKFFQKRIEGQTKDIDSVRIAVEGEKNGQVITSCQVTEGTKQHKFGYGLQIVELDWLVQEIGEFLGLGPPKLGKAVRPSTQTSGFWADPEL